MRRKACSQTEWQHIGIEINAAMIKAGTNFVGVHSVAA
jgi:hypothetical protein